MQSQASLAGIGTKQKQEDEAMEEKHMNEFVPAENFWASPLIIWIMKISGAPDQSLKMKLSSLCVYVKPEAD